ncbi:hypothetical protein [Glaciimonas sp. PCH181]|uniref:hypothetical protein n=1 Tax=Glaciimonas sp. PCH181 TaxID=2133943 RepID=UPI001374DB45|nr:hypothetical protein [Glaciimonas sp. PCH181]
MLKLVIEKAAVKDLTDMVGSGGDEKSYAQKIVVTLQEIKDSQSLLQDLTTEKFSTDDYDVGKYLEFWNDGIDLWKIKIYDFNSLSKKWWTVPYRVLYAYDISCQTFRVLGIVPRKFNYDPNHELTKRIRRAYDDLGLPKHKIFRPSSSSGYKPH